jgi:hypothetical protein
LAHVNRLLEPGSPQAPDGTALCFGLGCPIMSILTILAILALYAIPLILAWFVIYSAVLAAMRRHDRDRDEVGRI